MAADGLRQPFPVADVADPVGQRTESNAVRSQDGPDESAVPGEAGPQQALGRQHPPGEVGGADALCELTR